MFRENEAVQESRFLTFGTQKGDFPATFRKASFFHIIGNFVPYDIKPSGGCALARVELLLRNRARHGKSVLHGTV